MWQCARGGGGWGALWVSATRPNKKNLSRPKILLRTERYSFRPTHALSVTSPGTREPAAARELESFQQQCAGFDDDEYDNADGADRRCSMAYVCGVGNSMDREVRRKPNVLEQNKKIASRTAPLPPCNRDDLTLF